MVKRTGDHAGSAEHAEAITASASSVEILVALAHNHQAGKSECNGQCGGVEDELSEIEVVTSGNKLHVKKVKTVEAALIRRHLKRCHQHSHLRLGRQQQP